MALYWFEPVVAKDSDSDAVAYGAVGSVYDPTDTGFTNPLPVTLLSGSVTTTLSVGALGVTPEFYVEDRIRVVFKSGDFTFSMYSLDALEGTASEALQKANQALEGGGPGGGVDDAGMADLISDPGSATGAALTERFGAGILYLDLDEEVPPGTPYPTLIIRSGSGGGGTPDPVVYARDLFERVEAAGWGTADIGGAWTVISTAKTQVNSGRARVQTVASETQGGMIQGFSADDTTVHVVVALGNTAGARLARIQQRRQGAGVYHQVSVRQYGASHATSPGRVDISFDESTYTTGLLSGVAADALVHIKSRVSGSAPTLRQCKVWLDGTPEPEAWGAQVSTATGPQSGGGYAGLYFYSTGSEPGTAQHSVELFEVLGV